MKKTIFVLLLFILIPTVTMADSSISGQELKEKTVAEVAEIYEIDADEYAQALSEYYGATIKQISSFQLLHDNYAVEPNVAKDIAIFVETGKDVSISEPSGKNKMERTYHLIPISIVLILLYIISHILSKQKVISVVNHRKIWNILLLITFLASGILGILLVIRINIGAIIPLPFNILFWHVEIGIAMFAISVFHIIWHWKYYLNLFKVKKRIEANHDKN